MASKDEDVDRLSTAWMEEGDAEASLSLATRALVGIREGRIDPVQAIELMEAAAEPQFDAEGGDPVLVLKALRTAIPALRVAEQYDADNTATRLYLRCRAQVLLTRTYHVMGGEYTRAALEHAYGNLSFLVDVAGGPDALADILRRPSASPVGEHAVAALGIFMATIRRCDQLDDETRERLVTQCRKLLRAYLVDAVDGPVVYTRTDALTAQAFFLLRSVGDPDDSALVEAAHALDLRVRPAHARAQATIGLRDYEWALYKGDATLAELFRQQIAVDLARFRLRRHQRVIALQGYLAA